MVPVNCCSQPSEANTTAMSCGADSELLDRIGVGSYRLSSEGHLLATNSCLALLLAVDPNAAADLQAVPAVDGEREHQWLTSRGSRVRVRDVRRAVRDESGKLVGFEGLVTQIGGCSQYAAFERRVAESLPGEGALLWLDIARFRDVNEMLGQRTCESLIQQLEKRMSQCMPADGMVAHLGGSQFAVFFPGLDLTGAEQATAELLACIRRPLVLNGVKMSVNADVGVAISPEHGSTVGELARNAEGALYVALQRSVPGYVVYDQNAADEVRSRTGLAADLRRALGRGEFELFYQSQVTFSGEVRALEALLRWRHPTKGLLQPGAFIGIAEETGLIVPIGAWVIEEACRRCALWNKDREQPIKVCVNVSALQLYFSDFPGVVSAALQRTGLAPQLLELELTESVLLRDTRQCSRELEAIRKLGVTIAIDDFGTGYSSLSYLRKLPVDVVKIDRSYVADLQPGAVSTVVGAITSMAHGLGLQVVAEGIERTDQMEVLRALSVDLVQGYLFGRPKRLSDADPV